jgi:hypothetical protein
MQTALSSPTSRAKKTIKLMENGVDVRSHEMATKSTQIVAAPKSQGMMGEDRCMAARRCV